MGSVFRNKIPSDALSTAEIGYCFCDVLLLQENIHLLEKTLAPMKFDP